MRTAINLFAVALMLSCLITAVLVYIDVLHYGWFLGAIVLALLAFGLARAWDEPLPPK